jgi:hypothetical protein
VPPQKKSPAALTPHPQPLYQEPLLRPSGPPPRA